MAHNIIFIICYLEKNKKPEERTCVTKDNNQQIGKPHRTQKKEKKIGSVHGRMQNRNGATRNSIGHGKKQTQKKRKRPEVDMENRKRSK